MDLMCPICLKATGVSLDSLVSIARDTRIVLGKSCDTVKFYCRHCSELVEVLVPKKNKFDQERFQC